MRSSATAMIGAALLLGACGDKGTGGGEPTGQVVATVDGQEITAAELKLELGPVANDPQAAAAQQPNALRAIINRKLLADAAIERGLDKSPVAAMMEQKAKELALVGLLQQSIATRPPAVSRDEAQTFISENPALFSERKLITTEQLLVPQAPRDVLQAMGPLDTMEQVRALLAQKQLRYRESGGVLDTATIDPKAAAQIGKLAVGQVFVTPIGGGAQVSRIAEIKVQPLTGDDSIQAAQQILLQQRAQGQAQSQVEQIIKAGQSKVKINPAYGKSGKPDPKAAATT